jgi:ribose/xylose/arabinose/galactoside ABC-type transport system permease subunit
MSGARQFLRPLAPYAVPVCVLIATWIVMSALVPEFGGEAGTYGVLEQFALIGLLALGVGVTMICAELDISITSVTALASIMAVGLANSGFGAFLAILLTVLASAVFGAVQGYLIAKLRINSVMLTIGTLLMLGGIAYIVSNSQAVQVNEISITTPFIERHGIFSISSYVAIGVFVVIGGFLALARGGRDLYAIGGGRAEAEAAGVSPTRTISVAFAISAGCAGLAGALASMRTGTGAAGQFNELLLPAVAAALIGGLSLAGGRGTALNVALGVAIVGTISAALLVNASPASTNQLVQGGLLLTLLAIEFVLARVSQRRGGRGLGALGGAAAGEIVQPNAP